MAWIREHRAKDGTALFYVEWRGADRKIHSRPLGPVPRASAQAEADIVTRAVEGRAPKPEALSAILALSRFLAYRRNVKRLKEETLAYYRKLLDPCFRALSERGPMKSWREPWLAVYVAARPRWSPRTVGMLITSCRTFTKWARRSGIACPEFARDIEGPRAAKVERKAYTAAEAGRVLAASRGRSLELAAHLALLAGLSLGDIRGLTRAEVDLKGGWIVRRRSKTGRPMRIPVVPTLAALLKPRCTDLEPADLVCPLGKSDSSIYKGWGRLCAAADVEAKGGLKRLRHTWLTLQGAANVDRATRRDLMGHAPGSSESDVYDHSDAARLRAGAAAVERAILRGRR